MHVALRLVRAHKETIVVTVVFGHARRACRTIDVGGAVFNAAVPATKLSEAVLIGFRALSVVGARGTDAEANGFGFVVAASGAHGSESCDEQHGQGTHQFLFKKVRAF